VRCEDRTAAPGTDVRVCAYGSAGLFGSWDRCAGRRAAFCGPVLAAAWQVAKTSVVPALGQPDDPALPFFDYGLLKPGELAFSQVAPYVATSPEPVTVAGTLWLRDGIPLFDPRADGRVAGWLMRFDPARLDDAWSAVSSLEPAEQYKWAVVHTRSGETSLVANVLEGRRLDRGTAAENIAEWSAWRDPAFSEGLDEVARLVHEAAPHGVDPRPDTVDLWQSFFRL
jgi:hypothetical protein